MTPTTAQPPSRLRRIARLALLAFTLLAALTLIAAAIASQFFLPTLTLAPRRAAASVSAYSNGLALSCEFPRQSRATALLQYHAAQTTRFNTQISTPLPNQFSRHFPGGFIYLSESWFLNPQGAYETQPTSPGQPPAWRTASLFLPHWSLLTLLALLLLLAYQLLRPLRRPAK